MISEQEEQDVSSNKEMTPENNKEVDEQSNPTSSYFISLGENPSLVLVSLTLDGANYHSWAWAMEQALIAKNKFDFVDDTLPRSEKRNKIFSSWRRCNILVISWICHSISPEIAQSIMWIEDASEIWEDLKSRFSQGDLFRIAELKRKSQN